MHCFVSSEFLRQKHDFSPKLIQKIPASDPYDGTCRAYLLQRGRLKNEPGRTMTVFSFADVLERLTPFLLFAIYVVTSVRICRYGHWYAQGAPNPFLPRRLKPFVRDVELRLRFEAHSFSTAT